MGGSWVVRRTSQKAVMMDRCISAPADSLSGSGCMTARVLFLARAIAGGRGGHNALREANSERSAARQRQGPIRPDVTAIKLSPAFKNLNASKLGRAFARRIEHDRRCRFLVRARLRHVRAKDRSCGDYFGLNRRGSGQNDVLARARPPPGPAGTPSARQHPAPVMVPSGAKAMAHMPPDAPDPN